MNAIWCKVMWLLHPITLAVILVGIAGFLLGLIVVVERQDAAIVASHINGAEASRVARLKMAPAGRDSEVVELQAELAKQRAEAPSPEVITEAESRIVRMEAALADKSTELNALKSELDELSGQLTEAIQTRDDLRKKSEKAAQDRDGLRQELEQATRYLDVQRDEREQTSRDNENERANLEQTITGLRSELEVALERAREPGSEVAVREPISSSETPVEEQQFATAEPPAGVSGVSLEPAGKEPKKTTPAEPDEPKQPSAAEPTPVPLGLIAQGIVAYRATDYAKAYSLWLPLALKGSPRAQFFIGALYYEGRGVPVDLVLSYMWLRAATRKDDPGAIKLLDKLREGMSGLELAEAETRIAKGETIPLR
jgi:hypothetical protein